MVHDYPIGKSVESVTQTPRSKKAADLSLFTQNQTANFNNISLNKNNN